MNSINKFVDQHLMPGSMKFINSRPVTALKNGMLRGMPFIIIGSVFLILSSFPVPSVANYFAKTGLTDLFNQVYNASFGIFAIFAVVGIAYEWATTEKIEGLPAGLTALVSMLIVSKPTSPISIGDKELVTANQAGQITNYIDRTWLGEQGLITAIIVGLITGWLYCLIVKKKITIKMPEQVPSNVANSFVALIPAAIVILFWFVIYLIFSSLGTTLTESMYQLLQIPLQGVTDSLGGVIFIRFFVALLWFFGIHGGVISSALIGPITTANSIDNAKLVHAGIALTRANGAHIVTGEFSSFAFAAIGGTGMTLGLVIFCALFAKSKQVKTIGRLSFLPAIFNINEPVLFGLPIVLNPLMALPFILNPVIAQVLSYGATLIGIIPFTNGVQPPWTTPPIIYGFLVSGWRGALWQVVLIILSFFIWFPFIKRMDNNYLAQESAETISETK
ncbi:permease IIC component [Ligilactobacillus pabuli]|uniref:Permease IIC component n=1 Tax=Ligilactobacillus pabuli TaxID=2886039 RepID=A0ABQ5JFH9_9LACO|nr:PTS sugar transporter subunit IIC [Ligilactobacillus pabuli]GKS80596.1 permease IIC component [Ligilactobacillus pabuli]